MVLGGMGLGLVLLNRMLLQHAASETATEAAATDCDPATAKTHLILGYQPDLVECTRTGLLVTVSLTHSWPVLIPLLPETIHVEARAFVREPEPIP